MLFFYKKRTFLILFCCVPWLALAQGESLEDYVQQAMKLHPALAAKKAEARAAAQRIALAKGLPDPQLTFTHLFSEVETRTGPQENILTFSQKIPMFGKLRLRGNIAEREAEAISLSYEVARLEMIREVSSAYFALAYVRREAEIADQNAELLQRLLDVARERQRTARGKLTDALRIEIELAKLQDEQNALKAKAVGQSKILSAAVGLPEMQSHLKVSILRDLETPRASSDPDSNPKLVQLQKVAQAKSQVAALAQKNGLPDPSIGLNYIDIGGSGQDAIGVSLGFSLPIWRKKNRAARAAADASAEAAEKEVETELLALSARIASEEAILQESISRAKTYREKLLPASKEVVSLSEESYKSESATVTELIEAQQIHLDLQKTYWRAVVDAQESLIHLKTLSGSSTFAD